MIVLRATQKILKALPTSASDEDVSDTALGDRYVNRITLNRHPILLLVSSKSLLSILAPARNVTALPGRIGDLAATRLRRLGIDDRLIHSEIEAMRTALVGRTRDSSVLGQMVEFAKIIPYFGPANTPVNEATLRLIEDELAHTPCRCDGSYANTIWRDRDSKRLLTQRWAK